MLSPLESFKIQEIIDFTYPFSITNTTIYLLLILSLFLFLSNNGRFIKINWLFLFLKDFISHLYTNSKSYYYLSYLLGTFIFILLCNLIGLVPYSFTITAQFIITICLSFSNMVGITLLGLYYNGYRWFNLFVPHGVNKIILPFVIVVEVISYISRVLSLTIRLTANMIAGHSILAIFSGLGVLFFSSYLAFVPLIMLLLLLELLVAFIQAYVYTVLVSVYIRDSIYLH